MKILTKSLLGARYQPVCHLFLFFCFLFFFLSHWNLWHGGVECKWKCESGFGRSIKKELWVDKYKPRSLEELAVNKKKVGKMIGFCNANSFE